MDVMQFPASFNSAFTDSYWDTITTPFLNYKMIGSKEAERVLKKKRAESGSKEAGPGQEIHPETRQRPESRMGPTEHTDYTEDDSFRRSDSQLSTLSSVYEINHEIHETHERELPTEYMEEFCPQRIGLTARNSEHEINHETH